MRYCHSKVESYVVPNQDDSRIFELGAKPSYPFFCEKQTALCPVKMGEANKLGGQISWLDEVCFRVESDRAESRAP